MAHDVQRRLAAALEERGWSVEELRVASKLRCTRTSLHRKIYGSKRDGKHVYQPLTNGEIGAIAAALGIQVTISKVVLGRSAA